MGNIGQGGTPGKKHREFCHLIVSGLSQADAYIQSVSPKAKRSTANVRGCLLANTPHIKKYIQTLKEASWTASALSLAEKRAYLAEAVRTPVGKIDEMSPYAQEVIYEETKEGSRKKVKMVSKIAAMELDSKLAGDMYSDREGTNGNPFGWLVVMHKANQQEEPKAIEIGNSTIAVGE